MSSSSNFAEFVKEQAEMLRCLLGSDEGESIGSESENEKDCANENISANENNEQNLSASENDDYFNSDSEDDDSDELTACEQNYYKGRDGTKWSKTRTSNQAGTKTELLKNRATFLKAKPYAKNAKSASECWLLFIGEDMLADIVRYTNVKINEKPNVCGSKQTSIGETNLSEIKAVLGLLYLAGIFSSKQESLSEIWASDGTGIEIFRSTMPLKRFTFLIACMQFDDVETRQERKQIDQLAPIRDIFDKIVDNFQNAYIPGESLRVNEKLLSFRGKCPFRRYISNKCGKYGIKVHALVDAIANYVLNLEVYIEQPDGPYQMSNSPIDIVERMVTPVSGTPRNVTLDKPYTSCEIMTKLLKDHKLRSVGIVRKNETYIPRSFLSYRGREEKSTMNGFQENLTLLSHVPEKKKTVLLLSTFCQDEKIDESAYNSIKSTKVDELYSVARSSRSWPLTVWFMLLDSAGINSFIIYLSNNRDSTLKRRDFLKTLAMELLREHMRKRKDNPRTPQELRSKIQRLTGEPSEMPLPKPENHVERCRLCPRKRDRKTRHKCSVCKVPICSDHMILSCDSCTMSRMQYDEESE